MYKLLKTTYFFNTIIQPSIVIYQHAINNEINLKMIFEKIYIYNLFSNDSQLVSEI